MTKNIRANREYVAMALFRLGAAERAIETEDLAMQAATLAPGRFRWKKYPEQINLEMVHSAAKSLARGKPPLIIGSKRDGWMLTRLGIAWCVDALGEQVPAITSMEAVIDPVLLLRQTEAFHKFQRQELISVYAMRHFLRVDEYSSKRRRRERAQAVINVAGNDAELNALIEHLRAQYPEEWL